MTGEHTCMILKPLHNDEIEADGSNQLGFFSPFYQDFRQRFAKLLASTFRGMEYELALRELLGYTFLIYISIFLNAYYHDNLSSIIDPKINFKCQDPTETSSDKCLQSVRGYLSPHDMKRLEAYVDNLADFHRASTLTSGRD
ncbi:RNA cytidine acetyltransferase 2 [Glycine soja]